jgi:hypothetical protein
MPTPVEKTANSLKLRATPKKNALTVRIGTKKFVLPFEARMLSSDKYVFVHVPSTAMIMKVSGKALEAVTTESDAKEAALSFRKERKRKPARKAVKSGPTLPAEIHAVLGKIPSGYRLEIGRDGEPRLVRTRARRTSAAKPAAKAPAKPAAKPAAKPVRRSVARKKAK